MACFDPWSSGALGACVPKFPARPSRKVCGFTRTNGIIGTNGVGVILVSPSLANDLRCIYATTPTSNITAASFIGGADVIAGTATSAVCASLPYSQSQLNGTINSTSVSPGVVGRIVAAGIKVTYTGRADAEAGTIQWMVDPDHGNLNGVDIGSYREANLKAFRRASPAECIISGVTSEETEYVSNATKTGTAQDETIAIGWPFSSNLALSTSDLGAGATPVKFFITGTPEYVGTLAQSGASPGLSDGRGFELVQTAAGAALQALAGRPDLRPAQIMDGMLHQAARMAAPMVGRAIGSGLRTGLGMLERGAARAVPLMIMG